MKPSLYKTFFITCTFVVILLCCKASANISETKYEAYTQLQLISEVKGIKPGAPFTVALRMQMDPHWHTYWKNPGDSGLPVTIVWDLPDGFQTKDLLWHLPERIDIEPLTSYGFENEIYLLTDIIPPVDLPLNSIIPIKAKIKFLTCEMVCVAGKVDLELSLPVSDEKPEEDVRYSQEFLNTINQQPIKDKIVDVDVFDHVTHWRIALNKKFNNLNFNKLEFYPYEPKIVMHSSAQSLKETNDGYELEVEKSDLLEHEVARLQGVLVSNVGFNEYGIARAIEIDEVVQTPAPMATGFIDQKGSLTLALALGFAFLGGLILNLMPCVLPVLSIKLLNLIEYSKESSKDVAKHGWMFSFGVVFCFVVLSGIMLLLRGAGNHLGWGFQFQSPIFVISMAFLFFWLGLNLFGVFEMGTSLTTIKSNHKSSFMSGVLTTIVATPCTAPFMGSALGYGLSQPVTIMLLIFVTLGFGLSFPFLLITQFPVLLKFIPKPGPWMISLKKIFGALFMLTVLWLARVLSIQKGLVAVYALILGLGLAFLLSLSYRKGTALSVESKKRKIVVVKTFLLLIGAVVCVSLFVAKISYDKSVEVLEEGGIQWQAYSEDKIVNARKNGQAVFLDFTASWCLSCQVNERVALQNKEVIEKFNSSNILALKADWTNYDENVTKALESFNKTSIPLYVLYPKDLSKPPVLLPELITPKIILDYLENHLE